MFARGVGYTDPVYYDVEAARKAGKFKDEIVPVEIDNRGKKNTVLLFFPLAFTGVCTQEMCDVTAGLGQYAGLNADVILDGIEDLLRMPPFPIERETGDIWRTLAGSSTSHRTPIACPPRPRSRTCMTAGLALPIPRTFFPPRRSPWR